MIDARSVLLNPREAALDATICGQLLQDACLLSRWFNQVVRARKMPRRQAVNFDSGIILFITSAT